MGKTLIRIAQLLERIVKLLETIAKNTATPPQPAKAQFTLLGVPEDQEV